MLTSLLHSSGPYGLTSHCQAVQAIVPTAQTHTHTAGRNRWRHQWFAEKFVPMLEDFSFWYQIEHMSFGSIVWREDKQQCDTRSDDVPSSRLLYISWTRRHSAASCCSKRAITHPPPNGRVSVGDCSPGQMWSRDSTVTPLHVSNNRRLVAIERSTGEAVEGKKKKHKTNFDIFFSCNCQWKHSHAARCWLRPPFVPFFLF